jgi:hypothetical protein
MLRNWYVGNRSAVAEATESFFLNLSSPTNATILDGQGVCTIEQNPIIASVTVHRTTGKLPLAVYFDASTTTASTVSNPGHELYYLWDFGDSVGETWAYGVNTSQNKNVAFGHQASHVYKTAGTKTWTCAIIDGSGNTRVATGTITVSDWAEADTTYIDNGAVPVAGVNGVGSGASYYNETTWAGVVSRMAAGKRVRLKKGASWSVTASTAMPNGCQVDAYGTGSAPLLTSTADNQCPFQISNGMDNNRVWGLNHVGPGASVAESGTVLLSGTPSTNVLVLECESNATTSLLNGSADYLFIVGNNAHDFGATSSNGATIGVYATHCHNAALLGNRFDLTPSHCVRFAGVNGLIAANNSFTRVGSTRHAITVRGFSDTVLSNWNGLWTEKVIISDNFIDDEAGTGQWLIHCASQNTGDASRLRNIIIERNHVKASSVCIAHEVSENCTIRNNIFKTAGGRYAIQVMAISVVGTPPPSSCYVYHNTFYKPNIAVQNGFSPLAMFESTVSGVVFQNNLAYSPADTLDGSGGGSAPTMYYAANGASVTSASGNSSNAQLKSTQPWASATPVNPVDYTPNGYGVNGGVSVPVRKDFFNATITGTREIGAIQV